MIQKYYQKMKNNICHMHYDYDYYKNELEKYREKRVRKFCVDNNINKDELLHNANDGYIIDIKKD